MVFDPIMQCQYPKNCSVSVFSVFDRVWLFDEQFERTTGWSSGWLSRGFHPRPTIWLIKTFREWRCHDNRDQLIRGEIFYSPTIWLIKTFPRRLLFLNCTGPLKSFWIIFCTLNNPGKHLCFKLISTEASLNPSDSGYAICYLSKYLL